MFQERAIVEKIDECICVGWTLHIPKLEAGEVWGVKRGGKDNVNNERGYRGERPRSRLFCLPPYLCPGVLLFVPIIVAVGGDNFEPRQRR